MNHKQQIIGFLLLIPILILTISLGLLTLPLIIPLLIVGWYYKRKFNKELEKFLGEIEGQSFFCYNNRQKSQRFIEAELLPHLDSKVKVIFLNGRKIRSDDYPARLLSHLLYDFKSYKGFPHLFKVKNGGVIEYSVNQPVYNALNKEKSAEAILKQINQFFMIN